MSEPTTETGKRMASKTFRYGNNDHRLYSLPDILTIEREAAQQERERLRAMWDHDPYLIETIEQRGFDHGIRHVLLADPEDDR